MKKRVLSLSIIFLVSSALPSFSFCEKWKSEWLSVSINIAEYLNSYKNYHYSKISKSQFISDSEKIAAKIDNTIKYIEKTESCSNKNDKFEKRKNFLLDVAKTATTGIRSGELISKLSKEPNL